MNLTLKIVKSCAEFHAFYWDMATFSDKELTENFSWLKKFNDPDIVNWYKIKFSDIMKWDKLLLEKYMPANIYKWALGIGDVIQKIADVLCGNFDFTFIHGDLWIHNLMFNNSSPSPVITIDWQTCCLGNGLFDVATILFSTMSEWSEEIEETILKFYFNTLQDYGVTTYSFQKCQQEFQYAKLFALVATFPVTRRFFFPPSEWDKDAEAIKRKTQFVLKYINMALEVVQ